MDKSPPTRQISRRETVAIKLPSELLRVANLEGSSLSEEMAQLLALELYREDRVSLGRAAELCHIPVSALAYVKIAWTCSGGI